MDTGLIVRVAFFSLSLAILPRSVVPFAARAALGLALLLLCTPQYPDSEHFAAVLIQGLWPAISLREMFIEASLGVMFGAVAAVASYAAQLAACWCATLILAPLSISPPEQEMSGQPDHSVVMVGSLWLLLYLLVLSPFFQELALLFVRSLTIDAALVDPRALQGKLGTLTTSLGRVALSAGLLLSLPLFMLTLTFDLLVIVFRRVFPGACTAPLLQASRLSILILGLVAAVSSGPYGFGELLEGAFNDVSTVSALSQSRSAP